MRKLGCRGGRGTLPKKGVLLQMFVSWCLRGHSNVSRGEKRDRSTRRGQSILKIVWARGVSGVQRFSCTVCFDSLQQLLSKLAEKGG